jgi:hypothetical protein
MPPERTRPVLRRALPTAAIVAAAGTVSALYALSMRARTGGVFLLPLDDAYIYLQYAVRVADGHPFSYSPGDSPSSGVTSLLYLVALLPGALAGLRGDALAVYAFVLGGGFLAASALLTRRLLSRVATEGVALGGSALLLLSGPLTWGFFSGMEIGLLVLLLLAAADASATDEETGSWRRTPAVLALLALARPEGAIVAAVLALRGLLRRGPPMSKRIRLLLPFAALGAWLLLNFALTGYLSTSTGRPKSPLFTPYFSPEIYASAVAGWLQRTLLVLVAGVTPAVDPAAGGAVAFVPPLTLVLAALGATWAVGARPGGAASLRVLGLSAASGLLAAGLLSASWTHHGRYVIPFLAPLLVLVAPGVARAAALLRRAVPRIPERSVKWGLLAALLAAEGATLLEFVPQYGADARGFTEYREAARFLRDGLPSGARVAVLDAGVAAYYGGKPVVDLFGLTTPWMTESTFFSVDYAGSKFEAMASRPTGERPGYFLAHRVRYDEHGDEAHLAPFRTETVRSFPQPPAGVPRVGESLTVWRLDWDRLRPDPRPCLEAGSATLLDVLNVADVTDEGKHGWRFRPDVPGTFTANRLVVATCGDARVADGVRGIQGAEEFSLASDGPGPAILLMRADLLLSPVEIRVNGTAVVTLAPRVEPGSWLELRVPIAAGVLREGENAIRVRGRYRVARYTLLRPIPSS